MKTRVFAALVLIPVLLIVVLLAPVVIAALLVGAICAVASYELLYRTGLVRHVRLNVYSAVMAFCVALWSYFGRPYPAALIGVILYYILLFGEMMASGLMLKARDVLLCVVSGIMIPYMLCALVRILLMPGGRALVFIPFLMAFLSDTGAYFVGLAIGRHKLCPTISPKKTVEGFLGGIAAAVLGMLVYALVLRFCFDYAVRYPVALLYGLVGALGGVFGDLSLSVIKRQTGIKDYGNLIPGHGGILDRFDSVLVTAPLAEALLLLLPMVV